MSNGREEILTKIRKSLNQIQNKAKREISVKTRLSNPPKQIIPARAQVNQKSRISLFRKMAEEVATTTVQLSSLDKIPQAVINFLHQHNLPSQLKSHNDPIINQINWASHPTLEVRYGNAQDDDQISVTVAFAGVAETGTAVLISGPNNPTTLNFLPENHIIILPISRVYGTYEEVWSHPVLTKLEDDTSFPRTVNWITGPSRTGDIEQTMQLGIHGPRRLHIILIEDDGEKTK